MFHLLIFLQILDNQSLLFKEEKTNHQSKSYEEKTIKLKPSFYKFKIIIKKMELTIHQIYDKIRTICKDSSGILVPQKYNQKDPSKSQTVLKKSMEQIHQQIIKSKDLSEQYEKLEVMLQRQETEIRKRIGAQQQLKLYTDALKIQLEQIEKEKADLLENSKIIIKELKRVNQYLFSKIGNKQKDKNKNKSLHNKSYKSYSNNKNDHSVRDILKTEYIEPKQHFTQKKKKKKPNFTTHSTFQKKPFVQERQTNVLSRKNDQLSHVNLNKVKNCNIFSNYTLFNYLNQVPKKIKKAEKNLTSVKKQQKKDTIKEKGRVSSTRKIKSKRMKTMHNKSLFSVSSLQNKSNKKQNGDRS